MAKDYLSMASPSPQDAEHHGVKGMKWGVRNDQGHEGQKAKTTKIARLDNKFERSAQAPRTTFKIYDKAASEMNKEHVPRINNKPEYKNADFNKPSPLRDKYYKEMQAAFIQSLDNAATSLGTNASGTKQYKIIENDDGSWDITTGDVQHAADGTIRVDITYDDNGFITGCAIAEMMHFGVKGMKWGIRKSDSSSGSSTSGGSKSIPKAPANENSAQKYDRLRAQIKTHGPNSLEPDELNFVNARTEAIAKINKMNITSPGWLTDTSKVILQETTKTLMKDLAVKAGKEFIVKPLIKGKQ